MNALVTLVLAPVVLGQPHGHIWGGEIRGLAPDEALVCELRPDVGQRYSVVICPGQSWRQFEVYGYVVCHSERASECADPLADQDRPAS